MSRIDNYAILAKKRYAEGYYFVDGYKTLPTMRKRYAQALEFVKGKPHDSMLLVARNYNGEIVKVYESEETKA